VIINESSQLLRKRSDCSWKADVSGVKRGNENLMSISEGFFCAAPATRICFNLPPVSSPIKTPKIKFNFALSVRVESGSMIFRYGEREMGEKNKSKVFTRRALSNAILERSVKSACKGKVSEKFFCSSPHHTE
jgi:hypothetical protein